MPTLSLVSAEGGQRDPSRQNAGSPFAVTGLTVAYGSRPAVLSLDFVAPPGKRIAVVGPNGAGKSSFLKGALGIVPCVSGDVTVFGRPLNAMRRKIAYMPQRASVDWDFPATALDVVLMGLYWEIGPIRLVGRRHKEKARFCLARVGLEAFADRQIGRLSGGQQQRVFLARALAQDAALYIMDEPFAGVDAATERAIAGILCALAHEGRTVISVHHDLSTVAEYFDHVLLLNVRKVAEGPAAETLNAENLQAAYGGRLALSHLDEIMVAAGRRGRSPG